MTTDKRVALVTGASRGLGAFIAMRLAADGFRVAVNYAHDDAGASTVVSTIAKQGGVAKAFKADITDPGQVDSMTQAISSVWGDVDTVVNNATGRQPMLSVEESNWSDYMDQLVFFVKAPFLIQKCLLPSMKKARMGRVILIGSEVFDIGVTNFSAYGSAKGAMVGLTRCWAREFGPYNITVNLIAPGWIPVERHDGTPQQVMDAYASIVPLKRQGVPEDVAAAVSFLASEDAKFITGQCLSVNGGNTQPTPPLDL